MILSRVAGYGIFLVKHALCVTTHGTFLVTHGLCVTTHGTNLVTHALCVTTHGTFLVTHGPCVTTQAPCLAGSLMVYDGYPVYPPPRGGEMAKWSNCQRAK